MKEKKYLNREIDEMLKDATGGVKELHDKLLDPVQELLRGTDMPPNRTHVGFDYGKSSLHSDSSKQMCCVVLVKHMGTFHAIVLRWGIAVMRRNY